MSCGVCWGGNLCRDCYSGCCQHTTWQFGTQEQSDEEREQAYGLARSTPAAAAPIAGPGRKKYGLTITERAAEPEAIAPEKVLKLEEAKAMRELLKRKKAAAETAAKGASPWDEMTETAAKAAVPAEPKWPDAPWKSTRFAVKMTYGQNATFDLRRPALLPTKCVNSAG
jgi:hypothetical protein